MKKTYALPDPTPESVAFWLSQLDRKRIHGEGWIEINKRFHSLAITMRAFIREQYPDAADQEAVFDGLALGLWTMAHFTDINELAARLGGIQTSDGNRRKNKRDTPSRDRQ